ncbi:hypothetical protein [Membranihabitans marinus]|uniref:hypothetical protein n=1 Tax=Membranihabitans marinus TaxID=1227546 RepID=UPI001F18FDF6|nr:hypothetical protein [Membranihabitans marinus]
MKTSIFRISLCLIAFLFVQNSFAQDISERSAESDEGPHNAYIIVIDDLNEKVATDVWEDFIKDHKSKIKRIRKSKVKIAEEVEIPGLSGKVHVKSEIEGLGKSTELKLWFIQNGTYLSSTDQPESYDHIDRFIDNYFLALDVAEVKVEIENEENILKNLEKDLDKLKKDNDKLHKEILKAEETIRLAKEDIETNLADQKTMENKIEDQKKMVNQTKDKLSKIQ